jgi:glutamate synthase domain-containing protein 2
MNNVIGNAIGITIGSVCTALSVDGVRRTRKLRKAGVISRTEGVLLYATFGSLTVANATGVVVSIKDMVNGD